MKTALFFALAAALTFDAPAGRVVTDLSGAHWTLDGEAVNVPHTWNADDAADGIGTVPKNPGTSVGSPSYRRGARVYSRSLPPALADRRYFIRCEGVSSKAEIRVNGRSVGRHAGAFTAFCFEITSCMRTDRENRLEIIADNTYDRDVPPISGDFSLFGGVYRPVWLIETGSVCISPLIDGGSGVQIDANPDTGDVVAHVSVDGGTNEVHRFRYPSPRMWSPEDPHLYRLRIAVSQRGCRDEVVESFAFRKMEFRPDGFYLNGRRRQLRGVCRHQDRDGKGWAVSAADEADDVLWMKRMGADSVRTAHYPHSRNFFDLCDRHGLIVWTELPVVDEVEFTPAFRKNLLRAVRETVAQHRNHPSIAMWGLYNELFGEGGKKMPPGPVLELMGEAQELLHALDPSRRVVSASFPAVPPELNRLTDEQGFNLYPGWYEWLPWYDASEGGWGMSNALTRALASIPERRSIALSEYGAGATVEAHGDPLARCLPNTAHQSEEYQAYLHWGALSVLQNHPKVWGMFPWLMFDLGADRHHEGDRHGINNKGLVSYDRKTAKDAFYLYQANWSGCPVLHLVGSRMTEAPGGKVNVLAFSNVGAVALYVNGLASGERIPDAAKGCLWRDVQLAPGENTVEIRAGGLFARAKWIWRDGKCNGGQTL